MKNRKIRIILAVIQAKKSSLFESVRVSNNTWVGYAICGDRQVRQTCWHKKRNGRDFTIKTWTASSFSLNVHKRYKMSARH